ncbi:MAG: polysaccharide biosynthesis protein [Gammaproteobacteria bacterium]|nr:polysaccharide biosynthesis protein [Gammaproteobacteria bacterium]
MRKFLLSLPRNKKQALVITVDVISLVSAVWIAFMLRTDQFFWPSSGYPLTKITPVQLYTVFLLAPMITVTLLHLGRLYRSITRYITSETYLKLTKACLLASFLWSILIYQIGYPVPRSIYVIYTVLSLSFIIFTRYIATVFLSKTNYQGRKNVLIYGTGSSARQMANLLTNDLEIKPVGFISDDDDFEKTSIAELSVYSKKDIERIITKKNIDEILITLSEKSSSKLRQIVNDLRPYRAKLRKLPSIDQIARGKLKTSDFKKIVIDDLLGRDTVKPDPYLLKSCIENKTVLITGCGGSIGSELSRQIIKLKPKRIVLIEQSEFFLYQIDQELTDYKIKNNSDIVIKSYLGSIANDGFISFIFSEETIDTVYHAAAHKHVPLVEHNPLPAIETNIFGTNILANYAYKNNVENFVLISSDKAVRPTNIMGATKRFAELILQSLQDKVNELPSKQCRTKFCMVRFGNVLDTSGSVVPLFRKQIKRGGPVTVTDPRVIRYFMTIKEATELVIQTGSLSKGGDVFLLEMGEPVSVLEMAKEMIRLSGNEVKDSDNPSGDIEIIFTGLRAGEKLYEELLIGDNVSPTIHKQIMAANEEKLSDDKISEFLNKFEQINPLTAIDDIQKTLYDAVSGYTPNKNNKVVKIKK